jgi:flotillin
MQQQVIAEQVKIEQIEKQGQVKVQEAEIARREKELVATVLKPAEIERMRIETLAEAEKRRVATEAEGKAAAIRALGEAEADTSLRKGEAEAKAMHVKAQAYQEYNQSAILDRLIGGLPEIVRAIASPLANVDRITIVSTGQGDDAGMSKITGDIAKMVAQVPALFETLSGTRLSDLLAQISPIRETSPNLPRSTNINGSVSIDENRIDP